MTDDDLTPEQQEVRRLLVDARHVDPMPESVVARLDSVLAGLADEPVRVAPVTELATRRRRATSLLVAAAAVIAIGVGVGQVVGTGAPSSDEMSASTRDDAGADQDPGATAADPESAESSKDGAGDAAAPSESQAEERGPRTFAELSREAYSVDVSALRELTNAADPVDGLTSSYDAAGETCLSDAWGAGEFVPVRYDGIPAVLVFRRAIGDTQVADLFLCGDTEPRRSVTLPAP